MRVVFFGTSSFAAKVLSYLVEQKVNVVAVVTKPDRPKGRGRRLMAPPVKIEAERCLQKTALFQPEKASDPKFAEVLRTFDADLFVVVAYGEIIKENLLEMPKLACINVHASLLPKYRGAAPIQRCLINGEKETGITIMMMVKKMDAGDIIEQTKVAIGESTTFMELESALCDEGCRLLLKIIHAFEKGRVVARPQDHEQATYASKVELEECEIDWYRPAREIHNLIRGVTPHPGAWCWAQVRGQRRRIKLKASSIEEKTAMPPATLVAFDDKGLVIACGDHHLRVMEMQVEGKKMMTVKELRCGFAIEDFSF